MELTLFTEGYFNAAHHLENYDGKCSQMHGHTWKVCLWIKGEEEKRDKAGILWDFNKLNKILHELDHKYLNEVLKINPTVENISFYIYDFLKKDSPDLLFRVRVYESIIKKESFCEVGDF